ncbi:hypothetical protein Tco_0428230 [Tanacetum coccineum]
MFDSSPVHPHDHQTMEDFYRPSLIGRGGPIVPTTVPGTDFVLKNHMVQLLRQNCQFYGFKDEDSDEIDDDEPSEMIEDQKSIHHLSGSPTPSSDPCGHSSLLLSLPSGIGDIRLLERLLNLDSTKDLPPPHELNNEIFDPEEDILILENLLKDDPQSKALRDRFAY